MVTTSQKHSLPGRPQDTSSHQDRQMSFLAECINQVVNCTDVEDLSRRVVTLVHKVGYDRVQLFRYDQAADALPLVARYGKATAEPCSEPCQPSIGASLAGTVAATGVSRLCADVSLTRIRQLPLTSAGTGGELAVPIKLEKVGSSFQTLALQRFIAAGVDGFAVLPMNPEEILPLMQAARDKQMAVAWYDREDLVVESRTATVTADNHALGDTLGRQAGRWAATHVPVGKTLQVGVLSYRVMASVIKREHGILEGLNAAFGGPIEVVGIENGVDAGESLPIAEQWLKTWPELRMILAINDAGALGAYQAVIAAGKNNSETFFVGGIDATDDALTAIKQGGAYQATIDQSTKEKGVCIVQTLVAALTGQSYQPVHIVPCTLVTPANVDMFLANKSAETRFDQILGDDSLSARAGNAMTLGLNVFSLRNSYFAEVVEGAKVAAARLGVELIVSESTQILGVLDVQSDQAGALQAEDQRMLEIVSDLIATTLDKLRIDTERARQKYILDTFMANVPDPIYFKDMESRFIRSNQAHAQLFEVHDPAQLVGKSDFDFYPAQQVNPRYAQEQEIIRTGQPLLNFEEPNLGGTWTLTTKMPLRDEHGDIIGTFGISRDITPLKQAQEALQQAYSEITLLNSRLQTENIRMSAELNVVKQLQQMILPRPQELTNIPGLEIVGYMRPADEVGGDYYDVLRHEGMLHIGIGDVTGHGLESGMVMLMTQAAIRTLIEHGETDPVKFVTTLNRLIYKNVARIGADKNLTFALVQHQGGQLKLVGQHEELLIVRQNGQVERLDTIDLGFPVGLEPEIAKWVHAVTITLNPGDGLVLYTDGVTEAENIERQRYGLDRLCAIISRHWRQPAEAIKQAVVNDVLAHIGPHTVYDDITLVVLKQQ